MCNFIKQRMETSWGQLSWNKLYLFYYFKIKWNISVEITLSYVAAGGDTFEGHIWGVEGMAPIDCTWGIPQMGKWGVFYKDEFPNWNKKKIICLWKYLWN